MITPTLRLVVPSISVVLATMLAALPWGLSEQTRFLLPLLPFAAIHIWAMRRPQTIAEPLVFACGLALDVLSHGPLGFWSLVYLAGLAVTRLVPVPTGGALVSSWLHFGATLALLALLQWLLAMAFFVGSVDARPFLIGALLAFIAYPALDLVMRPLARLWPAAANGRFERGG